ELVGNGQLQIGQIEWLVGDVSYPTAPLTSNNSAGVVVTSNYAFPGNAWRVYDNNNASNQTFFFIDRNTTPLPVHITADFGENVISPTGVRISRATWSDNLTGLRISGSNDGENWTVFLEEDAALSDFVAVDGVDQATYTVTPPSGGSSSSSSSSSSSGSSSSSSSSGGLPEAVAYQYVRLWIDGSMVTSGNNAGRVFLREMRLLSGEQRLPISVPTSNTGNAEYTISSTTSNLNAQDRPAF